MVRIAPYGAPEPNGRRSHACADRLRGPTGRRTRGLTRHPWRARTVAPAITARWTMRPNLGSAGQRPTLGGLMDPVTFKVGVDIANTALPIAGRQLKKLWRRDELRSLMAGVKARVNKDATLDRGQRRALDAQLKSLRRDPELGGLLQQLLDGNVGALPAIRERSGVLLRFSDDSTATGPTNTSLPGATSAHVSRAPEPRTPSGSGTRSPPMTARPHYPSSSPGQTRSTGWRSTATTGAPPATGAGNPTPTSLPRR